jgi:hypothetical protein
MTVFNAVIVLFTFPEETIWTCTKEYYSNKEVHYRPRPAVFFIGGLFIGLEPTFLPYSLASFLPLAV